MIVQHTNVYEIRIFVYVQKSLITDPKYIKYISIMRPNLPMSLAQTNASNIQLIVFAGHVFGQIICHFCSCAPNWLWRINAQEGLYGGDWCGRHRIFVYNWHESV